MSAETLEADVEAVRLALIGYIAPEDEPNPWAALARLEARLEAAERALREYEKRLGIPDFASLASDESEEHSCDESPPLFSQGGVAK